jgi:hypothetical protein
MRGLPRWSIPLLILLLVAGAAVVARRAGDHHPPAAAAPSRSPADLPGSGSSADVAEPSAGTVMSEELGHPLLGVTDGWELFGRGTDAVVRIELARGRITFTSVTPPNSSGPVSFVVGRNWAVVRPLDVVPGVVVQDGQPPGRSAGALGSSGPAFPGPDPDHLWAPAAGNASAMSLVGPDGAPTRVAVALPDTMGGPAGAEPDGTGYLLVRGTGGVYLGRPEGLRRITTGDVLATGPSRWLTVECDDQHRCTPTVIDRGTGARHALARLSTGDSRALTGLISPDGAVAAVYENEPSGSLRLHLIGLSTGDDRRIDLSLGQYPDVGSMVWSPDSRWLFVAGGGGRLFPIEGATGDVHDLGVQLPPLSHVAIRPA